MVIGYVAPLPVSLDNEILTYTIPIGNVKAIIIPQGSKNARLARVKSDDQLPDNW